jgi:hypothetical protein
MNNGYIECSLTVTQDFILRVDKNQGELNACSVANLTNTLTVQLQSSCRMLKEQDGDCANYSFPDSVRCRCLPNYWR